MNVPATDCEQICRLHTFIAAHHQHKELLKAGIYFCSVNKIGKVFRIKTQTGQSAMFFLRFRKT